MLYLTQESDIYLAIKPVDFRKQIDGLASICEQKLSLNARSGKLFVFINRPRTMIRILCYQDNGYWLSTKRLSRGRYNLWPTSKSEIGEKILSKELMMILKSFVAKRRKIN